MEPSEQPSTNWDRRLFLQVSGLAAALGTAGTTLAVDDAGTAHVQWTFDGPDALYHGSGWETLNPGYWQIQDGALRRRLTNYGDRARATGFPFHYETHRRNGGAMNRDYDPSLPPGVLYRRDWKLSGTYALEATFVHRGRSDRRRPGDDADWQMYQPGYGQLGLALGAESLLESYNKIRHAILVTWDDANRLRIRRPGKAKGKGKVEPRQVAADTPPLEVGQRARLQVEIVPAAGDRAWVVARWEAEQAEPVEVRLEVPSHAVAGYCGVVGQGLLDFEVTQVSLRPDANRPQHVGHTDCYTCYPLGDTLARQDDGSWGVRFVGLFASDGDVAEIRVADTERPEGGWASVPVAGRAKIVNNAWRRHTASVWVTLPKDPSTTTLYYTVWKDGQDVTADARMGTAAVGPGTGLVGDVPPRGDYVGRLPQLTAPYKICGLSCHAITSGLQHRDGDGWSMQGGGDVWQFRDQPTREAYAHLEAYEFQVMCWEDDVWYMELVFYPPSTDDAYKVVVNSIAGPTSRWQMMRHWNVINPGDHDYGMDDVKGPEQYVIRLKDGLGQDRHYMRRNFQIVQHLITGEEEVDPGINPQKWRAWKMPAGDFTLAIVDSRLWRSSQDTAIWDDEGWGHMRELYDRADPTRSLLGEAQFAWLQELVRTDASRLICLTGLNGLHTVWTGGKGYSNTDSPFAQRDRVAADYAGWVAAGADRVIELLGSRNGIVTVYGDVHNGCILRNLDHGLIECSFGPIGRSGGRAVIPGFGPRMKDFDERPLEVAALYHKTHADPSLSKHAARDPFYWNFLEMEFDPRGEDPQIGMRIRNLVDPPDAKPRGGGALETRASATGRAPRSIVPAFQTLPQADVRFALTDGRPLRGTRSDAAGQVSGTGLPEVEPGTSLVVWAFDGERTHSQLVRTEPI